MQNVVISWNLDLALEQIEERAVIAGVEQDGTYNSESPAYVHLINIGLNIYRPDPVALKKIEN